LGPVASGQRQVVFVTGEAGIGKTTVVETFLKGATQLQGIFIARGQCLEHYGAGEPFLPVLEGISRLARQASGPQIVDLIRQHAPTWLAQMPGLVPPAEREGLQQQLMNITRERMLREMAEAVEMITTAAPMVLVLEDLHWGDYSTLDLISYLARRPDPARLMMIGTYRPVEVILGEHPLKAVKRELQAHKLCHELPLGYLTEETVGQYLAIRFPGHRFPKRLTHLVYRRTDGNPLFMVNVVEYLFEAKVVSNDGGQWQLRLPFDEIELGVPENIRQLIAKHVERLSPEERRVLEGASVVGMECSTTAIAAGLDDEPARVEEQCERLVQRHQFLLPARLVELPDGTVTPRYKFAHILYLEVPYSLIPANRRAQIHGRIGEAGVAIYGDHVDEIAAELAMHFEDARDWPRAIKYLLMAAENASRRSAHHEALALARRGLQVLKNSPAARDESRQELLLHITYVIALMAVKGFAAPEVEGVYQRARELAWQQGPSAHLFKILWLLGIFYYFRAELLPAREIAEQLLELASGLNDNLLLIEAHRALGVTLVEMGELTSALTHLDEVPDLLGTRGDSYFSFTGQDPLVVCYCFAARALWSLGFPEQALNRMRAALERARKIQHPQSSVIAAHFAAILHQLRSEPSQCKEHAETAIALSEEHGLELWLSLANVDLGWVEAEQGLVEMGLEHMRNSLRSYAATGATLWRTHFLSLMAGVLSKAGRRDEALAVAAEGQKLVDGSGERYSEAELLRLQGECLIIKAIGMDVWNSAGPVGPAFDHPTLESLTEATACLDHALAVARRQKARSCELRIATTLARLAWLQGRPSEAKQVLTATHRLFTEGQETADLVVAAKVLKSFSERG
jgi:tetratricopeptide (TPR) repeat protein